MTIKMKKGYTYIPNEIMEQLAKLFVSDESHAILVCFIKRTYEYPKISNQLSQLEIQRATLISPRKVSLALEELVGANIIIEESPEIYSFQEDYDLWDKEVWEYKESKELRLKIKNAKRGA